jgi:hypothetical protein
LTELTIFTLIVLLYPVAQAVFALCFQIPRREAIYHFALATCFERETINREAAKYQAVGKKAVAPGSPLRQRSATHAGLAISQD